MSYDYSSWEPVKVKVEDLSKEEKFLLKDSETFCIYPWIHLHSYPTGETYPCCHADMQIPVGNNKEDALKDIWNNHNMRELRNDMLMGHHNNICNGCYEQESHGFFSGRKSANKHHGHHIAKALHTTDAGTVRDFKMTYWDIRFSNLCNLSCRSCGHIFSSSWHKDQSHLAEQAGDPNWKNENKVLLVSGKSKTDMIDQVMEHIDHVEQIYFAGGEPLMMDWVEKGLLKHQDLNVNILQDPLHYRIDIAPEHYKDKIRVKFQEHIKWLEGNDDLQRATNGFISAVNYLETDNTQYLDTFWEKTKQLDKIRNENVFDFIPELKDIS